MASSIFFLNHISLDIRKAYFTLIIYENLQKYIYTYFLHINELKLKIFLLLIITFISINMLIWKKKQQKKPTHEH